MKFDKNRLTRISEEEAWKMAEASEPELLAKSENDATESAVALKRFPDCYVLGISCDTQDRFELYLTRDEKTARNAYQQFNDLMQRTGIPF